MYNRLKKRREVYLMNEWICHQIIVDLDVIDQKIIKDLIIEANFIQNVAYLKYKDKEDK